jgi:menaquinone-dependent protoporphyrinogen oxidase
MNKHTNHTHHHTNRFREPPVNHSTPKPPVLVTYATRYGSTAEVAEGVAEVIREQHAVPVDVMPTTHIRDLSRYGAAILGSSIINDRWLPEMDSFIERYQASLARIPLAFFITCGSIQKGSEAERIVLRYVRELEQHPVTPTHIGVFGGQIDFAALTSIEKYVTHVKRLPTGDHRNWEAIREWSVYTGAALLNDTPPE